MTLGNLFAIFEPWIWRRLGPVPACFSYRDTDCFRYNDARIHKRRVDQRSLLMDLDILQTGYYRPLKDSFNASGTITLLTSSEMCVVVDTGSPWDRDTLVATLVERNVEPIRVNWVFGTHGHVDHIGNLNLFQNSKMIVGCDIASKNIYENFDLKKRFYGRLYLHCREFVGHLSLF